MSNIKVENNGEIYDLDDLDGEQLVVLAMCAFLYMKRENKKSDEELLSDILHWFEIMTHEVVEFRPMTDEDLDEMIVKPDVSEYH